MERSVPHARAPAAVLALFLLLASAPTFAGQPGLPELSREIDEHLGEHAGEVRALTAEVVVAGLRIEPLHTKLREGLAKRMPEARIAKAMQQLGRRMLWTSERLRACQPPMVGGQIEAAIPLAVDALASGVNQAALAATLVQLCDRQDPVMRLRSSVETYLYLTQLLSAARGPAWDLAAELLSREEEEGAVNRLMLTLRQVRQRRGTVDAALQRSVSRLRAGISASRLRNELRESFLR